MTIIQSTELDFTNIKESLKTYLQRQTEFQDYNFEASGLSNIMDVLAYNTHVNGLIANFGLNESFLGSAQLRSSVVSHAETLGYYPRSKTTSSATITLQINGTGDTATSSVELNKGTKFTASVNEVNYTFQTIEKLIALNDGAGNFTFTTSAGNGNITIKEGTEKTKTFLVGETSDQQVYVIPDETIDTTTIAVKVFDSPTSESSTSYTDINDQVRINDDSTVFIVREVPNGYYEITFSDGNVLGKAPVAGNKIEITYLSTVGADANNASVFTAQQSVTVGGSGRTLTTTTVTNSASGAEKETIASIKANAPVAFATQQRLVTAEDYKALINQRYSSVIDDVIAWGGNDNVPPIYGRVYVGLKYKDGTTEDVKTTTQSSITSELSDNLGIMSIDTVFAEPEETFLEITVAFNFDPDLTGTTIQTTQTTVENTIKQYFSDNLNAFGKIFRASALLTIIDALSPAILNSSITTKIQQRLAVNSVTPADGLQLNVQRDYSINFPVALASPDDVNYIILSTNFTVGGRSVFLRNLLQSTKLQLISADDGSVVIDNVGSYDTSTGVVTINGQNITAINGTEIKITATPKDPNTIKPLRNYILKYDSVKSRAAGTFDFQNTAVTISSGVGSSSGGGSSSSGGSY